MEDLPNLPYGIERAETNGSGLSGLENRQIRQVNIHFFGQLAQRHPSCAKDYFAQKNSLAGAQIVIGGSVVLQ